MLRFDSVEAYIEHNVEWQAELIQLRKIISSCPLEETVKWGAPCYMHQGKNVVGMAAFKEYFGLWFHQGALLADEAQVLINAQEGKTKALRQWRFQSKKEIKTRLIKSYVKEAILLVEEGAEIKPTRNKALAIPELLQEALAKNVKADTAFGKFTKGKQREFADYVSEAKRQDTQVKRVQKIIPMIIAGEGLNDKYRK